MANAPFGEAPAVPVDRGKCRKHWFQEATGRCDECGGSFCDQCLAPPVRSDGPLRCVDCALFAAGVRIRPRRWMHART